MNERIFAKIKKVDKVLVPELAIPGYQRPYRWTTDNVLQLLEDVNESWKTGKNSYRIGSVILNERENEKNIVDGQQRITTILLVLKAIGSSFGDRLTQTLEYNHVDSHNAIINNHRFIEKWIRENISNEKENFCKYLLEYCEFVEIVVLDLSEAFQMFDSQNGRGKELEAYNLLKAFHIRAMENNTFDERIECDRKWENATRYNRNGIKDDVFDLLKQLFDEQLYRTRIWSRKDEAWSFSKKRIAEFKGNTINKHKPVEHPFQNKELLQYIVQNYFDGLGVDVKGIKNRFKSNQFENINPFVLINQNIINGKHFFDYIETYVEIYKQLFLLPQSNSLLIEFRSFFKNYCQDYLKAHRDGDRYLKEVYKSLIFIMFDKFGEEGVNKYYKILYALVYRVRLEKMQVKYAAIAEYPVTKKLFSTIEKAKSFLELQHLENEASININCRKEVPKVLEFFAGTDFLVSTDDTTIQLSKYKVTWK